MITKLLNLTFLLSFQRSFCNQSLLLFGCISNIPNRFLKVNFFLHFFDNFFLVYFFTSFSVTVNNITLEIVVVNFFFEIF